MEIAGPHTCDELEHNGWEVMDYSSCGPDFALSDYHQLELFKKQLIGKRCATDADVKQAVISYLQTLDTDLFLVSQCDHCSNVSCELEVWCVPSATRLPCVRRSQNKALDIIAW
jgi:hypothetical protein